MSIIFEKKEYNLGKDNSKLIFSNKQIFYF
jgi:hypothetical protein